MKILYEDNHVIAVVKPHGVLTQSDQTNDSSLMDEVKRDLKARYQKKGEVFLGLVHRLDRPVGGIVVFGKTSKGAARLSEQFRERTVVKKYLAVVEGCPKMREGRVVLWLKKNEATNRVTTFSSETPGTQRAELFYRVLETRPHNRALVEIMPATGRPHQIRVSMQFLGCPIVGDTKYGAKTSTEGKIALFAHELTFHKPVGGEPITLHAEPDLPIFS